MADSRSCTDCGADCTNTAVVYGEPKRGAEEWHCMDCYLELLGRRYGSVP